MFKTLDWRDLHFFLEVARAGTLTQAARRLAVEHTTVARRIDRLEAELKASLFDRRRDGYALTESGLALLPFAEAMESAALGAQESAGNVRVTVSGKVRLGAPEVFGTRVLAPSVGKLIDEHPELSLELLLLPRAPSLAAREADLLITLTPPEGGRYVVTRLTDIYYFLYGAPRYLVQHPPIRTVADLGAHRFVDYSQDYLLSDDLRYLDDLVPAPRRVICATGMFAQHEAVSAGVGLGMLTTYTLPGNSSLLRILPDLIFVKKTLWLAAPSDLLRLKRVRVVWDFLRQRVATSPELFGSDA